jgi:hypothetical protein
MNPRAQVTHAKTRLSASGEYVPTAQEMSALKRNLEAWFRSQGLTKAAAITYASLAFRDDDGATLESSTGDGAMPGAERRDAAKDLPHVRDRLDALADTLLAGTIQRKLSSVR